MSELDLNALKARVERLRADEQRAQEQHKGAMRQMRGEVERLRKWRTAADDAASIQAARAVRAETEVERLRTTDQGVRDLIARLRAKDEIESDEIADMIQRATEGGAR